MKNKFLLVIAGPTAVGKTSVAIEVARHFNTEIISADSRQCYKELNVGVARPSPEELQKVPHHFIASHSIFEKITAQDFVEYALKTLGEIFNHNQVAVVTGGTGLYIKALTEGMDEIPAVPEEIRQKILEDYKSRGLQWLQEAISRKDPIFAEKGEMQNPQRIMRALEVVQFTNQSIFSFRKSTPSPRDFRILKIALELPRDQLHENINRRVDAMMHEGLLQEAMELSPYRSVNALQTVGYKELFEYLDGHISLEDAVALIKKNTRQYAKRQMTWFRKDPEFKWLHPSADIVIETAEAWLRQFAE